MKIKITCTDGEYQAGLIYDVPEKKARELIDADKAFEIVEGFESLPDFDQTEKISKPKKVKYDDR